MNVSKFLKFRIALAGLHDILRCQIMSDIFVPDSLLTAEDEMRVALEGSLDRLPKTDFLRAWCSTVYLYPGLHPNGFFEPDNDWPDRLKSIVAEAWRRFESGELTSNELYCYQAALMRIERECLKLTQIKPWLFDDHFGA